MRGRRFGRGVGRGGAGELRARLGREKSRTLSHSFSFKSRSLVVW